MKRNSKEQHIISITLSLSTAVIIIAMMGGGVVEKIYGTNVAYSSIYGSPWFLAAWIVMTICGLFYLVKKKVNKRFPTFMIHISFVIILSGALTTRMFGRQGKLYLPPDKAADSFITNDSTTHQLPFEIRLSHFEIVCYRGTQMPRDYISHVIIKDNTDSFAGEISMNHILEHKRYRLYQSGYNTEEGGSYLSISYDPYGIALTYLGYLLLLISIISFLTAKNTAFRALINHPALRAAGIVLILSTGLCSCDKATTRAETLPENITKQYSELYILYHGRVTTVETIANDYLIKLYGKDNYKGMTPTEVFTGWIFYYNDWKKEPIIRIKNGKVKEILGLKSCYASVDDFVNQYNRNKLATPLKEANGRGDKKLQKAIMEADEKYNLIRSIVSASALKIYPYKKKDNTIEWLSQVDTMPTEMEGTQRIFVRKMMSYVTKSVILGKYDETSFLLDKLKLYQDKTAEGQLPGEKENKAQKIYNKLHYSKQIAIISIIIGLIGFFVMISGRKTRQDIILWTINIPIFIYISITISLRGYIAGHIPMSNGYETMQFLAWTSLAASILMRKKLNLLIPGGLLIAGLAMMVSMMGESNPPITQLMPVLASPLLSIHVIMVMLAYAAFAFVMLCGIGGIYHSVKKEEKEAIRLMIISKIIIHLGIFFIAIGIFVGAVWANQSWGRYWGWDPKETWALITMLIYAIAIHPSSLPAFRRPFFFHTYSITAFLSVLITYFGVNFLLGGLHSYA